MNEYKRYDNDLSYSSDERKSSFNTVQNTKDKSGRAVLIVAVIITAVVSFFICGMIFIVLANNYYSSLTDKNTYLNSSEKDASRQRVPITQSAADEPAVTAESILKSVVTVSVDGVGGFFNQSATFGSGNGVFIRDGGYILASAYILESGGDIKVTANNGKEYMAELVGTDEDKYISVIRINDAGFSPVIVGNSDETTVGERIIGVGNKLTKDFSNPVTYGSVCGYNSDIVLNDGSVVNVFQTDAASLTDSIGGLMFNYNGQLIGMCTAKYSISSSDIALVTPINDIINYANAIIDNTEVERTNRLGIAASEEDYGITIESIEENSAAEKAGLKHGDLIMKINSQPVRELKEITEIKNSLNPGDKMIFDIYRDGEILSIELILE